MVYYFKFVSSQVKYAHDVLPVRSVHQFQDPSSPQQVHYFFSPILEHYPHVHYAQDVVRVYICKFHSLDSTSSRTPNKTSTRNNYISSRYTRPVPFRSPQSDGDTVLSRRDGCCWRFAGAGSGTSRLAGRVSKTQNYKRRRD